jgi:enoyl-CoA hydratase/carnithine racemase
MVEGVVDIARRASVAVVTIARGKVNAIDMRLLEELGAALDDLEGDDHVRAVVLTGAGNVFSAGVDLEAVLEGGAPYVERFIARLRDCLERLFAFPKPTVAAVNGAAVAGGCVLACACDRRLIVDGARIGATELAVGVPFPAAAVEIIRHACGNLAETVVLDSALLDARGAVAMHVVHEVVEAADLLARATSVASQLGGLEPVAFRLAKAQLRRPVVERMRADASVNDDEAVRAWMSERTAERIRAQLARLGPRR